VLSGNNLANAMSVAFDGTPATIANNTASAITITTPPHAAGVVNVIVTTIGGSATTSYIYGAGPVLTSITPGAGPTGGGQSVVLSGGKLVNATSVTFDGTPAAIASNTDTSITVTTPAHAAGTVGVQVTTSNGTATASYTYLAAPSVVGVSPNHGSTGGGETVTISGNHLASNASVTFGGERATIIDSSASALVVIAPPHAPGAADIILTTDGGSFTAPAAFLYAAPAVAESIAPSAGPVSGGQNVTISGSALSGATSVTFGGLAATIINNTATSITVITPLHAAGAVDVVIVAPSGTTTMPAAYTYLAAVADAQVPTLSISMLLLLSVMLSAAAFVRMRNG
jgi:hypothetical protein